MYIVYGSTYLRRMSIIMFGETKLGKPMYIVPPQQTQFNVPDMM